jgi:hypothetical protein
MATATTSAVPSLEPLGLFTYGALKAGWFFAWRMTLYTLPYWGGALALAAGLAYFDPSLVPLAAVLVGLGGVAAFVASIPLTNRIARAWALAALGRRLSGGVWWGMFWRVLVVSLVAGAVFSAVQVGTTVYAATLPWSPMQMFITMIPYAVLLANVVITLRAYGWAMSATVVRRLDAGAPVAPLERAGTTTGAGVVAPTACPKCGGRELVTGTVIGRYCGVCGWREGKS